MIPSLALCVALYTFLSNNSKFREFGKKFWATVMLQIISIIFCTGALFVETIKNSLMRKLSIISLSNKIYDLFIITFLLFYTASWIYMCKIFYTMYGSLYHLRKKRFIKYIQPVAWFYEKFIHKASYEKIYRDGIALHFDMFKGIDVSKLKKLKNGGTVVLLYENSAQYSDIITEYIKTSIKDGDTVDYITTYKSPLELCKSFKNDEISNITKHLSIIDCFSTHYSFDDKIVKFQKQEFSSKGFMFFNAESFADVHTAANDSWYRFRKVCKDEENQYRIPHRTIYDTMSSLIKFSSEELYFLFLRHVIASEKSYGMISLFIEPISLENSLKNDLIRMADIVIEYNQASFKLVKEMNED